MDRKEVRAALARNIKALRSRRNWSQADLAEKAALSVVYLSDIERGNKWPYLDSLVKLANAFNIEVYELLKTENKTPPAANAIFSKYNEEITAIFDKSLEIAKKHASRSLSTMQKQYLKK
ncbi:MAG: helix-turn-helix domain-containing protein [Treponema sp.]|nr:helix-turn-helix domain-containing protein [Treponema sp.]